MSTPRLEAFLARLYTDEAFLRAFVADPRAVAVNAALNGEETDAVLLINTADLEVATRSFRRKREGKQRHDRRRSWAKRLLRRAGQAVELLRQRRAKRVE